MKLLVDRDLDHIATKIKASGIDLPGVSVAVISEKVEYVELPFFESYSDMTVEEVESYIRKNTVSPAFYEVRIGLSKDKIMNLRKTKKVHVVEAESEHIDVHSASVSRSSIELFTSVGKLVVTNNEGVSFFEDDKTLNGILSIHESSYIEDGSVVLNWIKHYEEDSIKKGIIQNQAQNYIESQIRSQIMDFAERQKLESEKELLELREKEQHERAGMLLPALFFRHGSITPAQHKFALDVRERRIKAFGFDKYVQSVGDVQAWLDTSTNRMIEKDEPIFLEKAYQLNRLSKIYIESVTTGSLKKTSQPLLKISEVISRISNDSFAFEVYFKQIRSGYRRPDPQVSLTDLESLENWYESLSYLGSISEVNSVTHEDIERAYGDFDYVNFYIIKSELLNP